MPDEFEFMPRSKFNTNLMLHLINNSLYGVIIDHDSRIKHSEDPNEGLKEYLIKHPLLAQHIASKSYIKY